MLCFLHQFAVCLYRDMMEAGRDLGVKNAGRSVVDCLRIERVIPQLGSELSSFVTPQEAGIMERVQLNKVQCENYNLVDAARHLLLIGSRYQQMDLCLG